MDAVMSLVTFWPTRSESKYGSVPGVGAETVNGHVHLFMDNHLWVSSPVNLLEKVVERLLPLKLLLCEPTTYQEIEIQVKSSIFSDMAVETVNVG